MARVCRCICVSSGFLIAALGLLLGFYVFPLVLHKKIDETVQLVNGSDAFNRWVDIPLPLQFKVYFFNVTNADEVQLGGKPKVEEIGPYVYDQFRHKYAILEENNTLSYYQNQLFFFNKEASEPLKEDDSITVAHLPFLSIIAMAEEENKNLVIKNAIPILFYGIKSVFLKTTVRDFLFDGIFIACDKANSNFMVKLACDIIKERAPVQLQEMEDGRLKFSLLSHKNDTHDGYYKVNSGIQNINFLGEVESWNNASGFIGGYKENSTCNSLFGTDATIFPPHRDRTSKINVFQSDICRSVHLEYTNEVVYKDTAALRYVLINETLSNNDADKCFCVNKTKGIRDEDGCLLEGALELRNCLGVPIVMTFPHFYLAHEKYKNTVDGLTPDKNLHQTFADIEPKSGTVVRGSKRVQFNKFLRKVPRITLTDNLADSLLPIVWIDEGVELDDKNIKLLYDSLFFPMKVLEGVYWALIGLGLAIGLIGFIWCMLFSNRSKQEY